MMADYAYCPDPDPRTLLCTRCGRLCEPRANGWQHTRPRCGAPMRMGETCARYQGHAVNAHRSRYALDNQNQSRRAA